MSLLLISLGLAAPLRCCADPHVQESARQYLRFHQSLVDGDRRWPGVLLAWEPVAARVAARAGPMDQPVARALHTTLTGLRGAEDPQRALEALPALSRAMVWLAVRHAGGGLALVEGACEDRLWLQAPGPAASPYGCGALVPE